ncbi:MAG: asparagine synthase, partial [Candidatus Gastranaerophilales bacterium]|nr:asparagine synthase [Candidatus Gastranaerophilales bacterium]
MNAVTNVKAELILSYNKGFGWKQTGNVSYKGYFLPNNKFNSEHDFIEQLQCVNTMEELAAVLDSIDGCFAIVINKKDKILIASDRIRAFPLFYSCDGRYVSDQAESIRKRMSIKNSDVDELLLEELRIKRNTQSGHTVYLQILQLEPGQIAEISNGCISKCFYYRHIQCGKKRTPKELEFEFDNVLDETFASLLATLDNKRLIVPLSGGYDSRLIVAMLKKKGIQDVLCYTYGREKDYEVNYSQKVAERLGYDWEFVEYTEDDWKTFLAVENEDAVEYFKNTHNHCTFPHLQDYIALRKLYDLGKIRAGDVVIPGFCGDFHAGSFTNLPEAKDYNIERLVQFTYKTHYINGKCSVELENEMKDSLRKYYLSLGYEICDRDSAISAYQEWAISGRIAMWVVNSVRVYEHFGLEFRLPQWEKCYIDFWYSVDNSDRIDCVFYRNFLLSGIFNKYDIDFIKPKPSTTHSNPIKSKVATVLKHVLIFLSVHKGRDYYRRNNINNYNYGALILYKQIKNKRVYDYNSLSIHSMEALWWCEKMY